MNKRKRNHLLILLVVLMFTGCTFNKSDTKNKNISNEEVDNEDVYKYTVTLRDLSMKSIYAGQIAPANTELSFSRTGIFKEFRVCVGDKVKKGQVLASIDVEQEKKDIENIQKSIEVLKKNYESHMRHYNAEIDVRNIDLKDKNMDDTTRLLTKLEIEKQELLRTKEEELYRLEYDKLQDDIRYKNEMIQSNQIIAPHDGVVLYRATVMEKEYINLYKIYLIISDESQMQIALNEYIKQETVEFLPYHHAEYEGKRYEITYQQRITQSDDILSYMDQRRFTKFQLKEVDPTLKYGDSIIVVLENQPENEVLAIPYNVINSDNEGDYVYISNDDEVVKTYIKLSRGNQHYIEVTEGLKEGDVIIDKK